MKINLKILNQASIFAKEECDNLKERELVTTMMLRRRLTRNSRIAIYLASEVGYKNEKIIFGSAYGEVKNTTNIIESIYEKSLISPIAFQNSVHNTPASYLSIVSGNVGEVTTVSDHFNTSLSVLKAGAIKALKGDRWLLLSIDACNFNYIKQINNCGISKLEGGVALLVKVTDKEANITIEKKKYSGISPSIWSMLEVYEKTMKLKNPIVEVEI